MAATQPPSVEFYRTTVAYLDALGSSAASDDPSTSLDFLDRLYRSYEQVVARLRARQAVHKLDHQVFSDLVCIAAPKDSPQALSLVLESVAVVLAIFASNGVLVRGGVTIDSFFCAENLVFGPAIVRAVRLEHETAMPRVALADEVRDQAAQLDRDDEPLPLATDLADDSVFVHFLPFLNGPGRMTFRRQIERLSGRSDVSPDVVSKAHWLAAYYNWGTGTASPLRSRHDGRFAEGIRHPAQQGER
ncbi:hypothetical protein SAMN05421812_11628 [Asanoa hainanensis]|uniref:Uncharacterized protein n=1 Tax=Asanoa hainanensis TaxID=560556 RepID=A0A239P9V2_9ACTN|nr:hypothetical protein [Asanoa hainanensis]SNT63916.1 hypothetical protein SAMN05421812_11628 [Asanoa hainanensis]